MRVEEKEGREGKEDVESMNGLIKSISYDVERVSNSLNERKERTKRGNE